MKRPQATTLARPARMRKSIDQFEIYDLIVEGYRPTDIAKKFGITRGYVYRIQDKMEAKLGITREKISTGFSKVDDDDQA
jgi:DNA-binding CsgD family transcriptional regulator